SLATCRRDRSSWEPSSSSVPDFTSSCANASSGGRAWPSARPPEDHRALLVELAQFLSDDQTLRDSRKQSTGADDPRASKRCSSTPLHWKPHFSRMLRDLGLATRAPAKS